MNRAPLLSFLVLLGGCAPFELGHLAPLEDALLGVDDTHSVARVVRVDSDPVQTTEIALAEGHATLVPAPAPATRRSRSSPRAPSAARTSCRSPPRSSSSIARAS